MKTSLAIIATAVFFGVLPKSYAMGKGPAASAPAATFGSCTCEYSEDRATVILYGSNYIRKSDGTVQVEKTALATFYGEPGSIAIHVQCRMALPDFVRNGICPVSASG